MLDFEFVQNLIRALDESSLDSLELERGGTRIRLSKSAAPSSQTAAPSASSGAAHISPPVTHVSQSPDMGTEKKALEPEAGTESPEEGAENYLEVTSPMVGTFYRAPAPDAPPYVEVGAQIREGAVLCIIEAMKLMNELESEVTGTVAKILVENAEPVEYGQVLFLIDPS